MPLFLLMLFIIFSCPLHMNAANNPFALLMHVDEHGQGDVPEELLLCKRETKNTQDKEHSTALHMAAARNQIELLEKLLKKEDAGQHAMLQDNEGRTALHRGAGVSSDVTDLLLNDLYFFKHPEEKKLFINMQDNQGMTALHFACISGKIDAVQILLKHGADPNIADKKRGRTALLWTGRMTVKSKKKDGKQMSIETSNEIQNLLLEHNADPKIADKIGRTPRDWARITGRQEELEQLRSYIK